MSASRVTTVVESHDGCRLAAFAEGEGAGLPVLFSNSLAADHTMWEGVVSGLERRAICYDSRGHGRSDAPAGPYDLAMLGRDALAVLDHFQVDRAVICGLSLGGLVAGWLAANHPDRVAGIVLANTALAFRPETLWRDRAVQTRRDGMAQFVEPTLARWFTDAFREKQQAAVSKVGAMIGATPPEGYAASCEALAAADMSEDLSAAKCPALVIAGEHDPSATVAHAEAIVETLGEARLLRLDAAHLSAIETPDEFREALESFASSLKS